MGSLYSSLSISYDQPLFLIAQSGDAISGKETVMFSDSQRLFWSERALESSKCHTRPRPDRAQARLPKFTFVLANREAGS